MRKNKIVIMIALLAAVVCLSLFMFGCDDKKPNANVTITTTEAQTFELEKAGTKKLTVDVKSDGTTVTTGINWTTSAASVATVNNGTVTAVGGGDAIIKAKYGEKELSFAVKVYDLFIENESDWWLMYNDDATLAGSYKLTADITLLENSISKFDPNGHMINKNFTGYLNGDNKTVTYGFARLFSKINGGTIENIKLKASDGFYWGSAIAFEMSNGVAKNIEIKVSYCYEENYITNAGDWIKAGGTGGLFYYVNGSTISDCKVTMYVDQDIELLSKFGAVAYLVETSTIKNCTATTYGNENVPIHRVDDNSVDSDIELSKFENNTVTNGSAVVFSTVKYNDYAVNYSQIPAKTNKTFEVSTEDTLDFDFTAVRNAVDVTANLVYSSSDTNVATVDNSGVVTFVGGGTVLICVSYDEVSNRYVELNVKEGTAISTEADYWKVFDNLDGKYYLTEDIVLSVSSIVWAGENIEEYKGNGHFYNPTFTGTIDGCGKTLTIKDNRMFAFLNGATIKNLNIIGDNGFYWGGAIAFGIENSTIENVKITAGLSQPDMYYTIGTDFTSAMGQRGGIGTMCVWAKNSIVKDCEITVTISDPKWFEGNYSMISGIMHEADTSTITNCKVFTDIGGVVAVKKNTNDSSTITDVTVSALPATT